MIMYAVRRYGFMLRTHPSPMMSVARILLPRMIVQFGMLSFVYLGAPLKDRHNVNLIAPSISPLSLLAEFGGLYVPSLAHDAELAYYASFDATFANHIIVYESELVGPLYGSIRQELHNVASSTLPWAV
jgi:hypothetical protein